MNIFPKKIDFNNRFLIILFFIITVIVLFFSSFFYKQEYIKKDILSQEKKLESCFNKKNGSRFLTINNICLQETVKGLLQKITTKELQKYIVATTTPALIRNNCHQISHIIGKVTYDNSKNFEEAYASCSSDCRAGCPHGVLSTFVLSELGIDDEDLEDLSVKEIEPIAKKYCTFDTRTPCHAMGHFFYGIFKDYQNSLKMCDKVTLPTKKIQKEGCYQGVFMESLGSNLSLFNLDEESISVKKKVENYENEVTYPCNRIDKDYLHACFAYLSYFQDIYFEKNNIFNEKEKIEASIKACELFQSDFRYDCFKFLGFRTNHIIPTNNIIKENVCSEIKNENDVIPCVLGVTNIFSTDSEYQKSLSYCNLVKTEKQKSICYNSVFSFLEKKYSFKNFCNEFKTSKECHSYLKKYSNIKMNLYDDYYVLPFKKY